ncbi:MAG TPA: hypothetical protein VHK05_06595 [Candidatus Limnocylindrales bacterium]|nr:hypothetical protein [Candidatus Limnocylindrales bacterium]
MTRETWLTVAALFVIGLIVRAAFAAQVVFPKPEDTAYYVGVARNLLEGRGLVSDALWSYATPPLEFPRPAFEVWLPLPTFLAVIPMLALGPTFAAAQVSSVLIGALVPVLAWRLAADVAAERGLSPIRGRVLALGTGLTAAVYLPLVLHSGLPDSTMPFTALALGACLLMTRVLRDPRDGRLMDPRLLGIGVLLGLIALTRNEAAWLALTWVLLVWAARHIPTPSKIRMAAVVAVIALLVFAPWAVRNWDTFGSPLPGQAVTNAFSVTGFDIFAWNDPPTLSRYLAVGPARLIEMRIEGLGHNLGNVLLLPGFPLSAVGLLALPWTARPLAVRPIVLVAAITFLITSLVFPVATTWGTFLHAAGPIHVLIVLSALSAIDTGLAALGRRLGWTKEVGWLAGTMGFAASLLFSVVLLAGFASGSRETARLYDELAARTDAVDRALDAPGTRLMSNFPIWVAETQRTSTLALPDEPPADVLDLAAAFEGTRYLVLTSPEGRHWPGDLVAARPGAECFVPVDLGPYTGDGTDPLAKTTVYEIGCPGSTP